VISGVSGLVTISQHIFRYCPQAAGRMENPSISCHKTGAAMAAGKRAGGCIAPGAFKDRMNGTAREIVSHSNSANSSGCLLKRRSRAFAVLVEWRAALEGVSASGTLKDTE